MRALEHFSFDVACLQCGCLHSHQQVPFACVALRVVASRVLCGLGLMTITEKKTRAPISPARPKNPFLCCRASDRACVARDRESVLLGRGLGQSAPLLEVLPTRRLQLGQTTRHGSPNQQQMRQKAKKKKKKNEKRES